MDFIIRVKKDAALGYLTTIGGYRMLVNFITLFTNLADIGK